MGGSDCHYEEEPPEVQSPDGHQLSSSLQNYKATVERAQCTLPDPQLVSGALIDVAKHLGNLSFRVWEKMKERVKFTPVILDPNTAHTCLSLSDDLTSVRLTGREQQLPHNPERNTKYITVLGSVGFSSGQHSWEVEVGDHPFWIIGVAESVDRKGERKASPDHGNWVIVQSSGEYTNGLGQAVTVKRSLQRIRVQLDYDRGELSFYDPEDMTHIYTHKHTFTEKLYSHFGIGLALDAKHPDIKISQSEVSLSYLQCCQPDVCVVVEPFYHSAKQTGSRYKGPNMKVKGHDPALSLML